MGHRLRRRRYGLALTRLLVITAIGTLLLGLNQHDGSLAGGVLGVTGVPGTERFDAPAARPSFTAPSERPSSTAAPEPDVPVIVEPQRLQPVVRSRPEQSVPASVPASIRRLPTSATVVFLGDSYTSGWKGIGTGSRGWPELVAGHFGWEAVNLAVPGTGFLNPGWTDQPVGTRVPAAIKQQPDIVVIAAGHNDARRSVTGSARAADLAIERLHRALPDAMLIIVAPIWSNGSPPASSLELRDHLRRAAGSIDAVFIDPLADRWFAGAAHRLIGSDGIHPTNAGHQYIADQVIDALE